MEVGILGPLEVVRGGKRLELGAPRQRAVLALLAVHLGEVVSIDRMIDELWGETPPNAATASLQAYVSNLRRVLEPDRPKRTPARVLVTEPPGYALRVAPDALDAARFERLTIEAREALGRGDAATARSRLEPALALWRGDPLADFAFETFAQAEIARLNELRAAADEDHVEALLALDHVTTAGVTLERLVALHPMREHLRALQMLALYRSGRQADALRAYEEARRTLADELGLEPGRELQELYRKVLDQDASLDAPATPRPTPASVPVPVHVAAPPAAPEAPGGDRARGTSPFVGREDVMAQLLAALEAGRAGTTSFVVLHGEPGVGKTRLAEELATCARERAIAVAWGRCHEDEGAPPLWPWLQVLRTVGAGDNAALAAAESGSDDDAARFRMYDAVHGALADAARRTPWLVVFDDLQWADVSSLRLLRFLAVELSDAAILFVATVRDTAGELERDDAVMTTLEQLARSAGRSERIDVARLDAAAVARYVEDSTGAPAEVAETVYRRSDGNPFFMSELVRLMQSEARRGDSHRADDIPGAVGDVVRRRLRRLPDDLQTALRVGAAIGREFDVDVLADACGLSVDDALDLLDAAVAHRIVAEVPASPTDPGATVIVRFSHGLVSELLYDEIPPARRARLHGRIGDAIARVHPASSDWQISALAHHYSRAIPSGRAPDALEYATRAATRSETRLAFDEAANWWAVAADALDVTVADSDGATNDARARLVLARARALRRAGRTPEANEAQWRALQLVEKSDDLDLVAECALVSGRVGLWQTRYGAVDEQVSAAIERVLGAIDTADTPIRARLLAGLVVVRYYSETDYDHALPAAREALAIAQRIGDTALIVGVINEIVLVLEPGEALAAIEDVVARTADGVLPELATFARLRRARARLVMGDATGIDEEFERAVQVASDRNDPALRAWAQWMRTMLALMHGEVEASVELAGEALALHERLGYWGGPEIYALHMLLVWREQGRLAEMAPMVEPLLAEATHPRGPRLLRGLLRLESGDVDGLRALFADYEMPRIREFTWICEMVIMAELSVGADLPCAADVYEALLPYNDQVAMLLHYTCFGAVAYFLGLLARNAGRIADARAHFARAVEINERIGARLWADRSRSAHSSLEGAAGVSGS